LVTRVYAMRMRFADKKDSICFHHSAINGLDPQYQLVRQYHKQKFGRDDMEYAALIEKSGKVVWHPDGLKAILYNAGEWNERVVGVCIAGHFGQETMTSEQVKSLYEVVEIIRGEIGTIKHLWNHRELRPTACPKADLRKIYEDEKERRQVPVDHSSVYMAHYRRLTRRIGRSVGYAREAAIRQRDRLKHRYDRLGYKRSIMDCCPRVDSVIVK